MRSYPQAAGVSSGSAALLYLEHRVATWTVIPTDPIFTFELTFGVWLVVKSGRHHQTH